MTALAPCEYRTGKTLGQGSYATVKEAVRISTSERFACKVISKKLMHGREHLILNEIEILKRVSKGHPNIVTLHDYFETPGNLYLVMDLCTGGELFDRIIDKGNFYEKDAAKLVRVIIDAVAYLHDQNIVHRDIKPENLLFKSPDEESDLLIADFGLSKIIDAQKMDVLMTTCGTPGYMAPEVIKKAGHGKPVDMWSIGVLTYFLLCGYMPFDSENNQDELHNILHAVYSFEPEEYWFDISDEAKDFISKLLIVDPSNRLTAREALTHPWLEKLPHVEGGVDLLKNKDGHFNARKTFKKAIMAVRAVNRVASLSPRSSISSLGFHPEEDATNSKGELMVLPNTTQQSPN